MKCPRSQNFIEIDSNQKYCRSQSKPFKWVRKCSCYITTKKALSAASPVLWAATFLSSAVVSVAVNILQTDWAGNPLEQTSTSTRQACHPFPLKSYRSWYLALFLAKAFLPTSFHGTVSSMRMVFFASSDHRVGHQGCPDNLDWLQPSSLLLWLELFPLTNGTDAAAPRGWPWSHLVQAPWEACSIALCLCPSFSSFCTSSWFFCHWLLSSSTDGNVMFPDPVFLCMALQWCHISLTLCLCSRWVSCPLAPWSYVDICMSDLFILSLCVITTFNPLAMDDRGGWSCLALMWRPTAVKLGGIPNDFRKHLLIFLSTPSTHVIKTSYTVSSHMILGKSSCW